MVRKSIVCFLVLAFLNLIITPGFVTAAAFPQIEVGPSRSDMAVAAGVAVAAVLIIVGLVYLVKKHQSAPAEQPQDEKQEAPQTLHFQYPDEQLITPSGQIALIRW